MRAASEEERHQDQRGHPQAAADEQEPIGRQHAEGRHQRQEDDHREILDQADAHQDPAVARVQLAPVEEHAGQHHRARHRDDDADDEALLQRAIPSTAPVAIVSPISSTVPSGPPTSATQRTRSEVLQRELDADREHEQNDTDLGERPRSGANRRWMARA